MAPTDEPSVLIVGAGVFGASTAYHLALQYKDASRITVIDRSPIPPHHAASTDINKIVRADYSSPLYAELAYKAMKAWREWPELKSHYHQTGWIMLDEENSDLSDRIRKIFRDRGHDPTKDVPLEELTQEWDGLMKGTKLDGFKAAYWNPEAGWCNASAATANIMGTAIGRGVNYIVGEVSSLLVDSSSVYGVSLRDGSIHTADKIVLATGAWTSSLLTSVEDHLSIPSSLHVEKQASATGVAVVHYPMTPSQMQRLARMPVIVYGAHGEVIPPAPGPSLLKFTTTNTFTHTITTRTGHRISVPWARPQSHVPAALQRDMLARMPARVLPAFTAAGAAAPASWRICWDARTPSQDWLVDRHPHPRLANLYLATGGSFHAYKFLPIIGKYVVNVVMGRGNGGERDRAWGWKDARFWEGGGGRGAHEATAPRADLVDWIDGKEERAARL